MRLLQLMRSILFTSGFFISTTLYAVVMLAVGWALPFSARWAIARNWAGLNLWMLKVLCNLDYEVEGRDTMPQGSHVAMVKHASTWETIAQALLFPEQAWVMKRELLRIPVVGWALHLMQPIAIDRSAGSSAVKQVIAQGKAFLQKGRWVVILPEGTRTGVGEQRKYGISGTLLAIEAGVSIVPVAHTAGYFWPRRGWLKRPGTIRVIIGKPIATTGRDARAVNAELQTWIEQTIANNVP
ncbi:MAG: lysophospholipid acyltransferase family protein [Steroidobacteraceae bacterium]